MQHHKVHILCNRKSAVTAIDLAAKLDVSVGKTVPEGKELVINWGSSSPVDAAHILNSPDAVRTSCNKMLAASQLFHAEIRTPELIYLPARVSDFALVRHDYPMIARTETHMDGSGFWLLNSIADLESAVSEGADFIVKMVPVQKEYRVHVFSGAIIRCQYRKKLREDADEICRTTGNGWELYGVLIDHTPEDVKVQGLKAVNALGLQIGAADVGVDEDGKAWVFEVNSAPALGGKTLARWAKRLNEYIEAFDV